MTSIHATEALTALGWDMYFDAAFADLTASGVQPARVVGHHRSGYVIAGSSGEARAGLAGRLRHSALSAVDRPAVGDWVTVAGADQLSADQLGEDQLGEDQLDAAQKEPGVLSIRHVLPRRSAFLRKVAGGEMAAQVVAANINVAIVVVALSDDPNIRRLERYLSLVWESGAVPLIVLNKADQCVDVSTAVASTQAAAPGVDVVPISATTGEGLAVLDAYLTTSRTAALLGSSGVGKSTLANRLLGAERFATGGVREDGRGRHTTTRRELVRLPGGALLIDTPGMRELQLWGDGTGVTATFAEIEALALECRFADCRHDAEPGCAVRAAVESGQITADRFAHWCQLQRELSHLARQQDVLARTAARARAKSMQRWVRTHLRRKYE